jgi:hypothetical protein
VRAKQEFFLWSDVHPPICSASVGTREPVDVATSIGAPAVHEHVDLGVIAKSLVEIGVQPLVSARNDQDIARHARLRLVGIAITWKPQLAATAGGRGHPVIALRFIQSSERHRADGTERACAMLHMRRHIFVVSRSNPDLYAYLKEQFAPESEVEVILDRRRHGDRRKGTGHAAEDRRHGDRRARQQVDAVLRLQSHVFLTLPAAEIPGHVPV